MRICRFIKHIALLATLLFCNTFYSQSSALKIGEYLPDIKFNDVLNYKEGSFTLSELKKKLVILRFWNTYCKVCITGLPLIDSIQQKYPDDLAIIQVSNVSSDSIINFFKKRHKLHYPSSILVNGDTILNRLFPHTSEPFHVWLDSTGQILSYTYEYELTDDNIMSYLDGNRVNLNLEQFKGASIKKQTAFDETIMPVSQLGYYSYIMPCKTGYAFSSNSSSGNTLNSNNCSTAKELYLVAFLDSAGRDFSEPGRLIITGIDTSLFRPPQSRKEYEEWRKTNTYTYQVKIPMGSQLDIRKVMQEDLRRFFGFKTSIERRMLPVMTLVRIGEKDMLKTKGGKRENNFFKDLIHHGEGGDIRYARNCAFSLLSNFCRKLVNEDFNMLYADHTGYSGNIDIELLKMGENRTLLSVNNELSKYGLKLEQKIAPVEVLVISR